jgi:nucleotide-binding universal stress UspA family protein
MGGSTEVEDRVFRRILVGFDGSHDARQALRTGIATVSGSDGEVVVLAVVSASHGETAEDRSGAFETDADSIREEAERELRAAARFDGTSSIEVLAGERPADVRSSYLEQRGFDLLVVGRHGRERAAHGGMGRVARELAEKASCPVLLVGDGASDGR